MFGECYLTQAVMTHNLLYLLLVVGASSFGGYSFDTTDGSTTNTNVVITSDGKVGIGTDSPEEKLHVNGKIRANDYDLEALPPLDQAP